MSTRHSGRRAASVVLAVALAVTGWVALGVSHLAVAQPVVVASSASIAETAVQNFQFAQSEFVQVPVNTTVTVTFTNGDTTGNIHTFTILNRSGYVIKSPSDLTTQLASYHALFSLTANSTKTVTASFHSPATGWYEFFCNITGHFGEGMYGFIAFGEGLPSNLSVGPAATGPGLVVFIIVGTIVTLTVLALVLGFVVGRRKGAVHEMPPERLGYPEPPSVPKPPAP